MYKRLALAQAFLGEPEIIILDEPTSGLDSSGGRKIRDTILALKEEKTLVVSSHNLEEMQHLCDHIAILDNGELVSSGPIDEITGLSQSVTVLLSRELDPEEQQRITGIVHIRECEHVSANTYRLTFDPHVSAEEIDTSMGQFQHLLIDSGITLRSLEKDNLIESVYRGLTGGG
jgi:ABC-type multidrug transport system ATPase subunit